MPDLRELNFRVDFSAKTFGAVVNLCKDLGIRYPEELSFCKPLEQHHLKKNYSAFPKKAIPVVENGQSREYILPAVDTNSFIPVTSNLNGSYNSLDGPINGPFSCGPGTNSPLHRPPPASTPISSPNSVSDF